MPKSLRRVVAVTAATIACAMASRAEGESPAAQAASPPEAAAEPSVSDLARLKQNPVSGLRQLILDAVVSPDAGGSGDTQGVYSLQLVWPFPLGRDWRLISYTILPAVQLPGAPGENGNFGLSDTLINLFVAPRKPGKIVWGVGPTVSLPTRTDPELGSDRVGLGPAAVVFYQRDAWSAGVVLQNVWSLGGRGTPDDVNELGAQYILSYNLPDGWYLYSNATITANWEARQADRWTVPIGGGAGKVFQIGRQSMSFSFQAFWNADTPRGGPSWSLNPQFALLFP